MRLQLKNLFKPPQQWARRMAQPASVGLFVGREGVNLVQMEEGAQFPRIRALALMALPQARDVLTQEPKLFKAQLRKAWGDMPFAGQRVVSSLGASEVKINMVSFKKQKGQSEEEALIAELRERMQGELDDWVVDFMGLRGTDPSAESGDALVALAPRKNVMTYLEALTRVGLEVEALDVGPNALARLVRHAGAQNWHEFPRAPKALLINVGERSSYLTVIWGRRLILDRAIEFSETRLLDRLVKVMGMAPNLAQHVLHQLDTPGASAPDTRDAVLEVLRPEIQALQQEINRTLVFMASKTRGKSIDVLNLAGCVVRYPSVLQGLQQSLQVQVHDVNPVRMFSHRPGIASLDESLGMRPGVLLATGLALRDLPERGPWT